MQSLRQTAPGASAGPQLSLEQQGLSEQEQQQFRECEKVIREGLCTFLEVGAALLKIREGKLFRDTHPDFGSYCSERWGICRSYAWRVMGADERVQLLPAHGITTRPDSESQVRPFLKLELEAFPKAWEQAVRRARNGKVTAAVARQLVDELKKGVTTRKTKAKRNFKGQLGQLLVLLQSARQELTRHRIDEAMAALDRVEDLIFRR